MAKELIRMAVSNAFADCTQVLEVRLMSDGRKESRNTVRGHTTMWKVFERGGNPNIERFRLGYELCGYAQVV